MKNSRPLFPVLCLAACASFAPPSPAGSCPPALSWSIAWASPGISSDIFYSVAVGNTGKAVAAGYETRTDLRQGKNWLLSVFNGDGKGAWTTVYDDPSHGDDVAQSVAIDGAGNLFVAGWEERRDRPSFADVMVRKMGPDGALLWGREYDGQAHGNDRAHAVAVDASGAVMVAGSEATRGGSAWLMLRYDSKGALKWARTCGGRPGMASTARAVAVDPAGGFVVAGSEQVGGFDYDWAVRKFDRAGKVLWSRTLAGAGGGWDEAHAVAGYPEGGVLVAGKVQQGGPGSRYSWQVARYSSGGEVLWTRTGPGAPGEDTRAFSVAIDACGRALVAGCTGGMPDSVKDRGAMLAAEYGPDGTLLCTWTATGSAGGPACALGAGLDRDGSAVIAGYGFQVKAGKDIDAFLFRYSRPPCPAKKTR